MRDQIISYVRDSKLDHPAIIGHSLGGFMAFYLESTEPTLFGPMVAVDGLPFLSALYNPKATAESSTAIAAMISKQMTEATGEQFRTRLKSTLSQEITDPANVDAMYAFCAYSDQANTGEAIKEMMVTDLRGDVAKITSQVLLIGAGQFAKSPIEKDAIQKNYTEQIASISHARLDMDWNARHFIQIDDPDFFYKTVRSFLAKGWPKH